MRTLCLESYSKRSFEPSVIRDIFGIASDKVRFCYYDCKFETKRRERFMYTSEINSYTGACLLRGYQ